MSSGRNEIRSDFLMTLLRPVYLDHNATTPCDEVVVQAMIPFFSGSFGNAASRSHVFGLEADDAVELAREQTARLLGTEPSRITFTSGATEALNLSIKGLVRPGIPAHFISFATEHRAVLDTLEAVKEIGADVTILPVTKDGWPEVDRLEEGLCKPTAAVIMMYANNETGMINPVAEVGRICGKHGVSFICDATPAVGKIPVDMETDGIDLLACSGHKVYGPKGVGVLARSRKSSLQLRPLLHGGGHERGMRSGTLNVPAIVGIGKALDIARGLMPEESSRISRLRDILLEGILDMPGTRLNGRQEHLLPHVANIAFQGDGGPELLKRISPYVAASSGSACRSLVTKPSHVLQAMGLETRAALGSIRFSLGRLTTDDDVRFALEHIGRIWCGRGA